MRYFNDLSDFVRAATALTDDSAGLQAGSPGPVPDAPSQSDDTLEFVQWYGLTGFSSTEPPHRLWIAFEDDSMGWMAGETDGDHGVFKTKGGKFQKSIKRYVMNSNSGTMVAEVFNDALKGYINETGTAFTFMPVI